MKTRMSAVIAFYDKDKKILLQDRRNISKWGEDWGFFGGGIEEGETPEQALVREIKEELEFELKEYSFVSEFEEKVASDMKIHVWVFVSPIKDAFKKFNQKEGQGMKFFSFNETKKIRMVKGLDEKVLKCLEEYLSK